MYEDKILVCKECGNEFTFTAGEQEFYAERGFQNEPQRCKACRDARKNAARGPVSTSLPPALPAAARLGSPLSPSPTVLFTAASASPRCASSRAGFHPGKRAPTGRPFSLSTLSQMLRSGKEVPGLRR